MKHFFFVFLLAAAGIINSFVCYSQTTLTAGDVAVVAFGPSGTDQFAVVLLKDIATNTKINFTDNGFASTTTGSTGEGYLTYTAPSNKCAGTILTWTSGMSIGGTGWSSNSPSGFSLNASGEQLFIFQGTADDTHWGNQSGITVIYGVQTDIAWITSGSSSSSKSYQPSASILPTADQIQFTSNSDVYFTSTTTSGSVLTIVSTLTTAGNFTQSTSSVTFPSYTSFTVNSVTVNSPSICGSGSATLSASGASTYTWAPNTNLTATTGASVIASPASTKTYTVTGTSTLGCNVTATSIVTIGSNPNVTVNSPPICNGSSGSLTANNASTYTWAPATNLNTTTGANVTASPTITTTYTVTGTNAAGCTASATSLVTVNAVPNVTVNTPPAYCNGGSASLTASGATTYTWAPNTNLSATTGANITASPTSTITYTVTGTTSICSGTATSKVTVNALPNVTVNSPSICNGSSTTLTANNASSYTWSPGTNLSATTGASVTASPTITTTYTVTGTGGAGCTATANSVVTVLNVANVTATNVTTDNSQFTISWTNPSCFDEIMVVGKSVASVTSSPSGDGSSYSSNQLFGAGTSGNSLNSNEYNVYQNSGTSVVVLGLTNGITYDFKIFTRKGTTWSTGVPVTGTPNPATGDYRSKQNGTWSNNSTWQTYNGSTWVNASSYPAVSSVNVLVQNTVTVDGAADPYKINHLIVQSGSKLYCNSSSVNKYVDVYGNITCMGTIGNDPSYDDISIDMDGVNSIIAGTGTFTATRVRKDNNDNTTTNVTIEMDIKLSWSGVSTTDLYNNFSGTTTFNVTIATGATVTCTNSGNVAIDGVDGTGSGNRGGTITVNGTLTVPGILYLTTDNSSAACAVIIGINGTINAGTVSMASSGAGTHTLTINGGGLLNITGTSGITNFSNTHNSYNLNTGSIVQYSAAGDQTIETGIGSYSYLVCSGSGNKTPNDDITVNGNLTVDAAVFDCPNSSTNMVTGGDITLQNGGTMSDDCRDHLKVTTSGNNLQTFNANSKNIKCFNFTSVKTAGGITLTGGAGQTTFNIESDFFLDYTSSAVFTDNGNLIEIGDDANLGSSSSTSSNFSFTGTLKFTSEGSANAHLSDYAGTGVCKARLFNLTIDSKPGSTNHKLDIFPSPSGGQDLFIDGTVTIANTNSAGTNFNPNGNTLNVKGDWTTYSFSGLQATINGNCTVKFVGTVSPQTISSSDYEVFYNYEANNQNGIILSASVHVNNLLTLTKGVISTASNEIDILSTTVGSVTGHSSASYVNGNLRRNVASTGTYDFPVGTASNYELSTVKLISSSGISNILATFTSGLPATLPDPSTCLINSTPISSMLNAGFWTITPDAFSNVNYDITLRETGYTGFSGSANQVGVIKRHNSSSPWLGTNLAGGSGGTQGFHSDGNQAVSGGIATVKRTGVQSFSDYGIGFSANVLPVTLTTFDAKLINEEVLLTWETESEYDNKYFAVERSANAIDFTEIGRVNGKGTTVEHSSYNFTDNQPLKGINYYRLQQVDGNNDNSYSRIVAIKFLAEATNNLSIFPSPANDVLHYNFISGDKEIDFIQVINIIGQVVTTSTINMEEGLSSGLVDVSSLIPGNYFIRITNGTGTTMKQFTKQ